MQFAQIQYWLDNVLGLLEYLQLQLQAKEPQSAAQTVSASDTRLPKLQISVSQVM